jgi:hypothetical protein
MCENPETETPIEKVGDTTPGIDFYTWTFTLAKPTDVIVDPSALDRYCLEHDIVQSFPMGMEGKILSTLFGEPEMCVAWSVKPFDFTDYKTLVVDQMSAAYEVNPNWRPLVGSTEAELINAYINNRKPVMFNDDGTLLEARKAELAEALEELNK